jgi:hypothetical protein
VHGPNAGFVRGIFFPHDGAIDSISYSAALVKTAQSTGNALVIENCPPVIEVKILVLNDILVFFTSTNRRDRFRVVISKSNSSDHKKVIIIMS